MPGINFAAGKMTAAMQVAGGDLDPAVWTAQELSLKLPSKHRALPPIKAGYERSMVPATRIKKGLSF